MRFKQGFSVILAVLLSVGLCTAPAHANQDGPVFKPVVNTIGTYVQSGGWQSTSTDHPIVGGRVLIQGASASLWDASYLSGLKVSAQWYAKTESGKEPVELEQPDGMAFSGVVPAHLLGRQLSVVVSAVLDGYVFEDYELQWGFQKNGPWSPAVKLPYQTPIPSAVISVEGKQANNSQYVLVGSTLTFEFTSELAEGTTVSCTWGSTSVSSPRDSMNHSSCLEPLEVTEDFIGRTFFAVAELHMPDAIDGVVRATLNQEARFSAESLTVSISVPEVLQYGVQGVFDLSVDHDEIEPDGLFIASTISAGESIGGSNFSGRSFLWTPKYHAVYEGLEHTLTVDIRTKNFDSLMATKPLGQVKPAVFGPLSAPVLSISGGRAYRTGGLVDPAASGPCDWIVCESWWELDGVPSPSVVGVEAYQFTSADFGKKAVLFVKRSQPGYVPQIVRSSPITLGPTVMFAPWFTISGTPKVGEVLSISTPTWDYVAVAETYQWRANGVPIVGAVGRTYKVTSADIGKKITAMITGRHDLYQDALILTNEISIPLLKFSATKKPKISGTAIVGSTLVASTPTWSVSKVDSHYQWYADGYPIFGATKKSFVLTPGQARKTVSVRVTGKRAKYASVVSKSDGVTVAKSKASVTGILSKTTIKRTQSTTLNVRVKVPGVAAPSGTVKVTVGKQVFSKPLKASSKGKVTLKLKGLSVGGRQRVKVVFVPGPAISNAVTKSATTSVARLSVK